MKKKQGFIAISLIYSFFLVFLMTLLAIVANYAHNRILLNNIKKATQEKLDNISEFNPVGLENKTYNIGDTISYANDIWVVVSDNEIDETVTLMLQRNLTKEELSEAIPEKFESAIDIDKSTINMCFNGISTQVCCYHDNATQLDLYNWENSLIKIVVDYWLDNNDLLQKAIARGYLQQMEFSDGTKDFDGNPRTYNSYIRIPMYLESDISNTWHLTLKEAIDGQSIFNIGHEDVAAHDSKFEIRPVITVAKAT